MDQVSAIELLIVHGYDALQQACMGFPKSRSACEIAASKGYLEMVGVLNGATARHMDVLDLQRAICEEDDKTFSRLVPEGVLIWSKLLQFMQNKRSNLCLTARSRRCADCVSRSSVN